MSDLVLSPDLEARIVAALRRLPAMNSIDRRLRLFRLLPVPLARPLLAASDDPPTEAILAAAWAGQMFDGTPALLLLLDRAIEEAGDPTLAADLEALRVEVFAANPALPDLAVGRAAITQAVGAGDWPTAIQAAHALWVAPAEAVRHLAQAWAELPIANPQVLAEHTHIIQRIMVLPDGRSALVGVSATLYHYDLANGHLLRQIAAGVRGAKAVAVTPDGSAMLVGGHAPDLELYDLATGALLRRFSGPEDGAEAVAISRDGRSALSGGWDKQVRLWDLADGRLLASFLGHSHWIQAVAFTPDGRYTLSTGYDKTLRLWDLVTPPARTGPTAAVLEGRDWITTLALAPDGRSALTGSTDGIMFHWDLAARHLVRAFGEHLNTEQDAAFSPNGRYVLTCHNDGTVRVWHVATGRQLRAVQVDTNLYSLALSPDGCTLLAGGYDGRLYAWAFPPGVLAEQRAADLAT